MEEHNKKKEEHFKAIERLEKELVSARNHFIEVMARNLLLRQIQHQLSMQRSHQLSQNNPPADVPQDAYMYPMSGSKSQDPGIQGAIVGATNSSVCGLSGDHSIGGVQRAEVMVPQDQLCNDIDALSLRTMVVEEHKPPVPHGI